MNLNTLVQIVALSLLCSVAVAQTDIAPQQSSIDAPQADPVDNLVAAGIALKTKFIFVKIAASDHGMDASKIKSAFETLLIDSQSFSDTKSGNAMRESTKKLVKHVEWIWNSPAPFTNPQFIEYLKIHGIDPNAPAPDPAKLAGLLTNELKSYVGDCSLPPNLIQFESLDPFAPLKPY